MPAQPLYTKVPITMPNARFSLSTDQTPTLVGLLRTLHRRGHLLPLLRKAMAEEVGVQSARDAGLSVPDDELQRAANDCRHRHGLASADQTRAWLASQHLSVHDLEAALERDLLIAKFQRHLAEQRQDEHFAAHRPDYDRVTLRQIVVDREDLAREVLHQLREDGQDFAHLARLHSLHPSAVRGGALGPLMRKQLPAAVAEAVFAASPGTVVGPLPLGGLFHLFLVEEVRPAELDEATAAVVRQEVFQAWLDERLQGVTFFPYPEGPVDAA